MENLKVVNQVSISGRIVEFDGKFISSDSKENKKDFKGVIPDSHRIAIAGRLIIRTIHGDVEVKVYVGRNKKDGSEKKSYTYLSNILEKKVPVLSNCENKEDVPVIKIFGNNNFCPQIKPNKFVKDGEVKKSTNIDFGFSNIIEVDVDLEDTKAEFNIVGVVKKIEDEKVDDVATGRAILKLIMIDDYKEMAYEVKIIVEKDIVDDLKTEVEIEDRVIVGGIVKTTTVENKSKSSGRAIGVIRRVNATKEFKRTEYVLQGLDFISRDSEEYILDSVLDIALEKAKEDDAKLIAIKQESDKKEDKPAPASGIGKKSRLADRF